MSFENTISLDEANDMKLAFSLFTELKDRPKVRQAKIACRNHPLSAPRNKKDSSGGPNVEDAIESWCKEHDGKDVNDEGFYGRWGITRQGVPGRSSFFLRASRTCKSADKFNRWECKRALEDGLSKCDTGSETHGLASSVSCLDYSIDLSGVTYDGMPPWAEKVEDRRFPPPEDAEKKNGGGRGNTPICTSGRGERPLTDGDLNRAIDAFCQDGKKIMGFGKYSEGFIDYPPKTEPQFYPHDGLTMHLTLGMQTVENGAPEPYQDMRWCR